MNFERSDDIKVSLQLGKRALIMKWLDTMGVKNYTINPDLTIDVKGNVDLSDKKLTEFPDYIKFNNIYGHFYCQTNQLTSLKGCPINVSGDFGCWNNQLISLKGCPTTIGANFDFVCAFNHLTSLEGCPRSIIDGYFDCSNNMVNFTKEDVLKVCKVNLMKIKI
jgi:hypothetical protein